MTSDEQERFLAALRTDAAFREAVRRELLTEELLGLPERFNAFVDEMHAFVEEMHAFVAEVRAFVSATNQRFEALESSTSRLERDSARFRGMILERKVASNPGYYLSNHGRRIRTVPLDDLLDALGIDDLSDYDYTLLSRTDVIAQGSAKEGGASVVFLVEVSWRPHTGDVERQVARRQVLLDRGVNALAVIASEEEASDLVQRLAADQGVVMEQAPHRAA